MRHLAAQRSVASTITCARRTFVPSFEEPRGRTDTLTSQRSEPSAMLPSLTPRNRTCTARSSELAATPLFLSVTTCAHQALKLGRVRRRFAAAAHVRFGHDLDERRSRAVVVTQRVRRAGQSVRAHMHQLSRVLGVALVAQYAHTSSSVRPRDGGTSSRCARVTPTRRTPPPSSTGSATSSTPASASGWSYCEIWYLVLQSVSVVRSDSAPSEPEPLRRVAPLRQVGVKVLLAVKLRHGRDAAAERGAQHERLLQGTVSV